MVGVGEEPVRGRGGDGFREGAEMVGAEMDVLGVGGDEVAGFANVGEGGDGRLSERHG